MENTSPIPIPPPTAEQYATPSPGLSFLGLDHSALSPASTDSDLPTWCRIQVAVRSTGKDRASRKKHRKSVSYALGLPHCHASLNKHTPTPFPSSSAPATITTPIIEDAEAIISTGIEIPQDARPSEHASSEEHFRDRNGMGDYSHFISCDETALTSSTFALPIDSWFADREDELALSLVNIFCSAESAVADVTHLHADPRNSPHTFAIVHSLQAKGLHDTVKEITSSFEKFGGYPPPTLSEVEQINSGEPPSEVPSPKMENTSPIPIPPPTAEQYATPSPGLSFLGLDHSALSPASTDSDLPTWCRIQVAVRSTGKDRASRKKHRKSVSYALGLPHCHASLNEHTPTPFPSSSAPRFPKMLAPVNTPLLRNTSGTAMEWATTPTLFVATAAKKDIDRLFKAKPRTWDFYSKLKQWEDAKDAEFEDHEASFYEDLNYDHNLYDNTDN
ncbi:hypothetical protein M405DRAFT_844772 [Rhizopogon salebrosus TDB-379]|nr:hypothetical protein M405DRAFT_844772 [Rhizopogon salebrosus TDB-379]